MAILKSYTCSKCAGILTFDSDQEFFDCPFCGNRYDIVDFHADEVLDQARSCLAQKSFAAAREKFDQVLANDPENFDALLGSVLSILNISSVDKLDDDDNLSGRDLNEAKKALVNAKRLSVNEKAEFFSQFIKVIGNHENIVKAQKEKDELLSGKTREQINSKMLKDRKNDRFIDRLDHMGKWWLAILFAMPLFALLISAVAQYSKSALQLYFFIGCIIAVVVFAIVMIVRKDKKEDEKYDPALKLEQSLDNEILDQQREYYNADRKLKEIFASVSSDNKATVSMVKSEPAADPDIDAGQNISCSKCGAKLSLDKIKRVYECGHCGVAYGVSLFFGLPMEKALNSLNTGDYSDAEKRFSHLLMVNPSDFEALLGKILCAGKWTKVSDIRLSSDYEDSDLNDVKTRIDEAVKSAADNDRPYFENLGELIGFFDPYLKNSKILEEQNKVVSDMETKADVYATAYAGANYDSNYKNERQKLVSKTYPAQVALKKLEGDFARLKGMLMARSECRLVN